MFPVYMYEEGMDLPDDGTYYLVAGNGTWLHKDTGVVKAFVPVENIAFLQDLNAESFIECTLPKIPTKHVWRIKKFFKDVVAKHHSEAATILFFNKETKEFKIHVPTQRVSHGSVKYKIESASNIEGMEGFLCVGTIHSHCDFNAFHSGTDIEDEEDFDGLHVTFGHNHLEEFSISASIVVNGHRLQIDPLEVLDGIEPVTTKDRFKVADLSPDLEIMWSAGIEEEWMPKLNSSIHSYLFGNGDSKFKKGSKVDWVGSLNDVASFKNMCGEGPFLVDSSGGGNVTIVTKVGLARFNEKLFKEYNDDKKN